MEINWGKQLVDQGAHFLAGAIVVCIWIKLLGLSFWLSFALMMGAAYAREVLQHRNDRDPSLGTGSYVDLVFFALGGLTVLWMGY